MMKARELKSEFNYAGAAFVVASAAKDILMMRLLTDMQDKMDINDGELPIEMHESLRIIVCTLKAKLESKEVADWILDYYRGNTK